jgi:Zn-dependent M28 family amino/carboxypeptidase
MVGARGAADAASPVAVMLELVRLILMDPRKLQNTLVFLFNGAEETLQDASHAFITKSPWFKGYAPTNLVECDSSQHLKLKLKDPYGHRLRFVIFNLFIILIAAWWEF